MSFGALSANAVRALARGAKMAGCYMSTGEGSLSPYHVEGDCDILYQIGPAKFGCRTPDGRSRRSEGCRHPCVSQVKMVEIKLAQGAKPGKGGVLPRRISPRRSPRFAGSQWERTAIRRTASKSSTMPHRCSSSSRGSGD